MAHLIRKIETREETEAKQKKKTRMLVGLMLLLLLGSTAGYAFLSADKVENGTEGVRDIGGQWAIDFNGQTLVFSNPPNVTKITDIKISYDLASYNQKVVYVAGENNLAKYEIASTLGGYASRFQEACYGNCSVDLPEKTCNDYLIVLNGNNTGINRVYQKDNCVFIEGDIVAVDAFLYRVFGLA